MDAARQHVDNSGRDDNPSAGIDATIALWRRQGLTPLQAYEALTGYRFGWDAIRDLMLYVWHAP